MDNEQPLERVRMEVVSFSQRLLQQLRSLVRNFLKAITNYLRSKTRDLPTHIPQGKEATLKSLMENSRFQEFMTRHARESGFTLEQVEENVRRYLDEIAADMNYLIFPFWDFILSWAFQNIYEGLVVDTEALDRLQPIVGKKPIVFVPNHRSHMDYLLLSYVTYYHRFPMPHVAGGLNLSFWPLGWLARKSGAFFIRRSFEGNKLYGASVRFYLEEELRQKNVLEFFIEGGRSRTGKLLPPRMGILSFIVESFLQGATEDVVFVPTSVSYESILEEKSYLQEQSGSSKKEEGIADLFRLGKLLKKKQGKVYLRFGEPLSLQAFVGEADTESLRGQKKEIVQSLARELTYGINRNLLVTPTSLASLTLLGTHSRATRSDDFQQKCHRYLDYLKYKGAPLSEPLRKYEENALREALRKLTAKGLVEEFEDEGELFYHTRGEKRGSLDYYKNNSLHFFVSLAALCRILEVHGNTTPLSLAQVESDFSFLQSLFRYEFTFSRRQPLLDHLDRLLEYLGANKGVDIDKKGIRVEDTSLIQSFSTLLENFFESYWITWRALSGLGERRWEEKELLHHLRYKGRVLYLKEEIDSPEARLRSPLQNSLQAFVDLGVLRRASEGWGRRVRTYFQVNRERLNDPSLASRINKILS